MHLQPRVEAASKAAGKAAELGCQLEVFGSQSNLIKALSESSKKILEARSCLLSMAKPTAFDQINVVLAQARFRLINKLDQKTIHCMPLYS